VTAIRTQVVFDAGDPHALAAFWADALHYEHEEIGDFVSGLLSAGHVPAEYTIEIEGKRRWRSLASLRHPDDPIDDRGAGKGRRILFQAVPEAKSVKNRVHLDLIVGPGDHDAEVERLVALGATVVSVHDGADGRWTLMVDPEGNEFDVS
jgi:Glyoxalase-like domain